MIFWKIITLYLDTFTLLSSHKYVLNPDPAKEVKSICDELSIDYIFKASYKKANRSKNNSFTGIGDEKALNIIKSIGDDLNVDTITDVHESHEPSKVANYVNHIQIPAFLCRQTDLLIAAGNTGLTINIKKGQYMSHDSMQFALEKVVSTGNKNVWLCERGNSFGYNDLIVDATAITKLKKGSSFTLFSTVS